MPISITVREHDNLERVLKRFNRLCQREGLQKAVKRYSYYEKPSEKRRRKIKERMRNIFGAFAIRLALRSVRHYQQKSCRNSSGR